MREAGAFFLLNKLKGGERRSGIEKDGMGWEEGWSCPRGTRNPQQLPISRGGGKVLSCPNGGVPKKLVVP